MLWGYTYLAITPDMFNDLTIKMGIIWGKVYIDTVKELVVLSNITFDSISIATVSVVKGIIKEIAGVVLYSLSDAHTYILTVTLAI